MLATLLHLGLTVFDRVEVKCELVLAYNDVPRIPLLRVCHGRDPATLRIRKPAK